MALIEQLKQQLEYLNAKAINMADSLHLTAVVDGVAWLEDAAGKTITVRKGSNLNGYGDVVKIDDAYAKVYTSSGYVFN